MNTVQPSLPPKSMQEKVDCRLGCLLAYLVSNLGQVFAVRSSRGEGVMTLVGKSCAASCFLMR
jgi:hypothetical protein